MMKKQNRFRSLSRLLLWSHVIGIVGFYLVLWLRTTPAKDDRARKLPSQPQEPLQSKEDSMVSIIVPARNEERNIRRCISSLLEQTYGNNEVIVVDDGSTDETPQILDELAAYHRHSNRLYVLRLRDKLPEGWAGKPYAIHKGTQEARGEWLLFTDADTWHAPDALSLAVAQATREHIDMLSFGTQQELPGFWEKVSMPLAYIGITMQYPPRKINDPLSPIALANGQYILIRRAVYDTLGGYGRPELRNTLLDDRDLAQLVKWSGFRLRMVDGRDLVHVHMYSGLRDIWHGWRKNVFLGSRGGIAFTLLQLIGLPMISIVPFLLPLILWMRKLVPGRRKDTGSISTTEIGAVTLLELVPLLAYKRWVDKELRVPWYYAFTFPLAGALFEGILAQSTWRILTGKGVDWRGREYYNKNIV
jgi:chlorobactene glucosyltransferase